MRKRLPSWLLLALAGAFSAIASAAVVGGVISRLTRGSPTAVIPAVVQMGDHENGKTAVGRFLVANSGTADLQLERFATTCSCAAVEIERDGQIYFAEKVRVAPGEQVELIARVAVGGRLGTAQRVYVTFTTNDPQAVQPMVALVIGRIKGGVTSSPLAVVFGQQPLGSVLKQRLRIYDNGVKGRRLSAVRSLNPDRFSATLFPAAGGEDLQDPETSGELIGVIEVVPVTRQAGLLDGRIEIQVADEPRPPDHVDVIGQVVGPVATLPSALVLPRATGGKFVYDGRVSVSARDGSPIVVTPAPAPAGWVVSVVADRETPGGQAVLVSRTASAPVADESFVARLNVTLSGGESVVVEIPILTRRAGP